MSEYTLSSILPFVRAGLRRVRADGFSLTEFVSATWTELEKSDPSSVRRSRPYSSGNPDNPEFNHTQDPASLKQSAAEAWLYLQRRGFVTRGTRNFPSLDNLHLEITNRGHEWIDAKEPIPELQAEYLVTLQKMAPNLDDVVREYVVEGLGSFQHDRFRAAAVMIGAASEKALYMLAEKMLEAISTRPWKENFSAALNRRDLAKLFNEIKKVLEHADKVPARPFEIFDGGQDHLVSLIKAVQVQRNNAVHPMNEKISDDTVRLSYLAFPYALQRAEQLRDWFSKNPNIL
jgi:hypothetical protein